MNINELEPKQGNVDVIAEVTDKDSIREFEKFGKTGKVCNATIKDESGSIKLTLWNEQIDTVNVGDKLHVTNGYVNEWQGEKQLTTGKFGKLEVLEKNVSDASNQETEEEKTVEEDVQTEEVITEDDVIDDNKIDEDKLEKSE